MCDEYIDRDKNPKFIDMEFSFIMMYDMWLNNSAVWPVLGHNPEWDEWEKLKKIKVKRKDDHLNCQSPRRNN